MPVKPINELPWCHMKITIWTSSHRRILLEVLKEFEGTLALISHNRHFLRSFVDQVFKIDSGKMTVYKGYDEYYLSKTGHDHKAI